jgi:hypothetical protein
MNIFSWIYELLWWYWFAYKWELIVLIVIAIIVWLGYCIWQQGGLGVG